MPVEIVQINPTHAELKEIYGENAKEVTYTSKSDAGNRKVRLDFFVENKEYGFKDKFALFLEDNVRKSQNGNVQIINAQGRHTWAKSSEECDYEWFDSSTARVAKDGECRLYDMLIALVNADTSSKDSNLVLENLDAIFDGDVRELRDINKNFGKGLRVLTGVRDGKYQSIYTGHFNRNNNSSSTAMMNAATAEYGSFKDDFGGDAELREYVAPTRPAVSESVSSETDDLF